MEDDSKDPFNKIRGKTNSTEPHIRQALAVLKAVTDVIDVRCRVKKRP
jgi:hypothetical protein